jgi:hypothetical protein
MRRPFSFSALAATSPRQHLRVARALVLSWEHRLHRLRRALLLRLLWYESSRHTFASRALAGGARYEEVSKALGHSSVAVTARYYDRHQERSFASLPSVDLGQPSPEGKVLNFPRHGARPKPEDQRPHQASSSGGTLILPSEAQS